MSRWRPEHLAAVVRISQGLVQVRVIKHLPEPIYGPRVERTHLHFQEWCHRLDRRELVGPGALHGIADDPSPGQAGCDFLEQLQQLSGAAKFESGEAGGVAAGLR